MIMEYWNDGIVGLSKDIAHSTFMSQTIITFNQQASLPKPIFPIFQFSSIPVGAKPLYIPVSAAYP